MRLYKWERSGKQFLITREGNSQEILAIAYSAHMAEKIVKGLNQDVLDRSKQSA